MKDTVELSDLVTPDIFKLAERYLEFEGKTFNEHVKFLGLDPNSDFRFSDLSGFDFSGAKLGGFDFTGADLRGATGANVQWDSTTILKGADTNDSLFAYTLKHQTFLAENPAVSERINLLLNGHWAHTILNVEKLLSDSKYPHGMRVARAVFDETDDIVVRSNVLLFMRLGVESGEDHRQFIFNIIARHGDEVNVVRAALRALDALYSDCRACVNIFKAYLTHEDEIVRQEALRGIIHSRYLPSVVHDILPHLSGLKNGFLRRTMLSRIAQMAALSRDVDYIAASRDSDVANALDYEDLISEKKMESIARAAILKDRYHTLAAQLRRTDFEEKMEDVLSIAEDEILERAAGYKGILFALRAEFGIPFSFEVDKLADLKRVKRRAMHEIGDD